MEISKRIPKYGVGHTWVTGEAWGILFQAVKRVICKDSELRENL